MGAGTNRWLPRAREREVIQVPEGVIQYCLMTAIQSCYTGQLVGTSRGLSGVWDTAPHCGSERWDWRRSELNWQDVHTHTWTATDRHLPGILHLTGVMAILGKITEWGPFPSSLPRHSSFPLSLFCINTSFLTCFQSFSTVFEFPQRPLCSPHPCLCHTTVTLFRRGYG